MKVEINGTIYTVEARGRAKAVQRAAELAHGMPAKPAVFLGYEKRGVVYSVEVDGRTILAIVRNEGEV